MNCFRIGPTNSKILWTRAVQKLIEAKRRRNFADVAMTALEMHRKRVQLLETIQSPVS